MDTIKLAFIDKMLNRYGSEVGTAMRRAIRQQVDPNSSGSLKNNISHRVFTNANTSTMELSFPIQGRYIDMGVGKGHPIGSKNLVQKAIKGKSGRTLKAKIGRKRQKVYAAVAYGKLGGLVGDLAYGLTQETINTIKEELKNKPI